MQRTIRRAWTRAETRYAYLPCPRPSSGPTRTRRDSSQLRPGRPSAAVARTRTARSCPHRRAAAGRPRVQKEQGRRPDWHQKRNSSGGGGGNNSSSRPRLQTTRYGCCPHYYWQRPDWPSWELRYAARGRVPRGAKEEVTPLQKGVHLPPARPPDSNGPVAQPAARSLPLCARHHPARSS